MNVIEIKAPATPHKAALIPKVAAYTFSVSTPKIFAARAF